MAKKRGTRLALQENPEYWPTPDETEALVAFRDWVQAGKPPPQDVLERVAVIMRKILDLNAG